MKLSTLLAVTTAGLTTVGYAQTERDLDSHEHGSATLNVAVDNNEIFLEIETPWNNLVGFEQKPGTDEQYAMVSEAWAQLNAPEGLFTMNDGDCSISEVSAETSMPIEPHDEENHGDGHDDHHGDAHGDEKDDHHDDAHSDEKDEHHDDAHGDENDEHHDDAHSDEKDEHHDDSHSDEKDDHHDDAHSDEKDEHHDDAHGDEKDDHHDDAHNHEHDDEETHSVALASYGYSCGDIARLTSITVNVFTLWSGFEELDVQMIGPGGQTSMELTADQSTIKLEAIQ